MDTVMALNKNQTTLLPEWILLRFCVILTDTILTVLET
jgi:hypothetical protein